MTERTVSYDANGDFFVIEWGHYAYVIEGSRIPSPRALLEWVAHLTKKSWPGMTPKEIGRFVELVFETKEWTLWHGFSE